MSKPEIFNCDVEPTAANPHTWMALLIDQAEKPGDDRVMWGVLRPRYRGFTPSAAALAKAKLTVAAPEGTPEWTVTAHRAEALLPEGANDRLLDPRRLFEAWEAERPVDARSLATYVTVTWNPSRLHEQWETGRALFRGLVEEFGVAVLLVQHVPSMAGSNSAPHLHAVIPGPRKLLAWGFGAQVSVLAGDRGRKLIVDRLAALRGGAS